MFGNCFVDLNITLCSIKFWSLTTFGLFLQLENKKEVKDQIVILLLDMLEIVTRDIMDGDVEG